jgi:hypothetical protein
MLSITSWPLSYITFLMTINRLKDSDVTWLYGPLHTVVKQDDKYSKPKQSSTHDKLGLIGSSSSVAKKPNDATTLLKPALKKRSVSDILRRPAPKSTSRVLLVDQPKRTSELSLTDQNNRVNAVSPEVLATHRQPKLRFNSYVEQCIALSDNDDEDDNETGDHASSQHHHSGVYEDDDVMVLNVTKRSTSTPSIMKIEPTRLKRHAPGDFGADSDTSSVGSYDLRRSKQQQAIQWIGQPNTAEYETAEAARSRDMDDDLIQNYDWAAWDLGPVDSDDDEQENDYQYQDVNYRQDHFDDEEDMEPPTLFFNEPSSSVEEGETAERLRTLANQLGHPSYSNDSATVVGNVVQWAKSYIFGGNQSTSSS